MSNIDHNKIHIGSAQRNRELGNRPRSGLWHRKEGKHGRKIRKLPPMSIIPPPTGEKSKPIVFTVNL